VLKLNPWLSGCALERTLTVHGCGSVLYHYDESWVSEHAYVCWVLDVVAGNPVFHLGANRVELSRGLTLVFDAYHLHACLPKAKGRVKMLFALGVMKLTPAVRESLGIKLMPIDSEWVSMSDVAYNARTGSIKGVRR
jgi:hypothetical protein